MGRQSIGADNPRKDYLWTAWGTHLVWVPPPGFLGSFRIKERVVTWSDSFVTLRFKDGNVSARYPGHEGVFRYDRMSGMVYERSKHSRIVSAILLSPLTLFSKRKHRWFSWNYVDADSSKRSILLRIDKKEERLYRRQVPILTGLELETIIED